MEPSWSSSTRVVRVLHLTGVEGADVVDVDQKVKAVVQVAGMHSLVRIDNDNESRRAWFRAVSSILTWPILAQRLLCDSVFGDKQPRMTRSGFGLFGLLIESSCAGLQLTRSPTASMCQRHIHCWKKSGSSDD